MEWLDQFEYELYKLPRPTGVFFLDVPVKVSQDLIKDRKNKFTDEDEKDIHESDIDYLEKTYNNSKFVAQKYNWELIDCVDDDKMKSIEDIHEEIYARVKRCLKES